jgi:serine/threonine-protein kinase
MQPDRDALEVQIDALRRAGRFAEAANLCLQLGEPARASELFAAVWDWPAAIRAAIQASRYALAFRHALEANDRATLQRLLTILPEHPSEALEAAGLAERKGRVVDAARLHEAVGDLAAAAELYERAGELGEAARCHESSGDYRKAGMLYERRIKEDPTDGEAALRLGRILAHFGRFDHAARALQIAEQDPERRRAARALLVACFSALKLHDAAGACLDRLREREPELPMRVADFLRATYGDERGLAAYALGGTSHDAAQLLAGRYRVLRPLGSGATGRVLLTHDGFYDREVAVKVLSVGTGAHGRDSYARFAKEARVAAGIDHPNVVAVYEFNPDGPFLVMEHMAGGTLEDRLERSDKPLPLSVVRHVVFSVLRGLEAVHRRGVIHRDLKPANVFFGSTGDVKIGDFGVAHLQDLGATLTGAMLGTLAYMAPEQITGSARPEAATDLYALGCILFRMLTRDLPYPGPDFVAQHLELPVPKVSEKRTSLGDRFDALVERLLAKEPRARFGSVDEAQRALDALDWTDPEHDALAELVADAAPRRPSTLPSRPPSAPASADRYELLEPLPDGAYLAVDTLLARRVRIEPCDEPRALHLRKLARADGPFVQAILDVDPESSRAILEVPRGEPLSRALLDEARRATVREQIASALQSFHELGLVHGDVRLSNVIVGPGRAVLLLPEHASSEATADDDVSALAALF